MWIAYKKYEPNKGLLATYFNYNIRNRLIDMLRKNAREQEKDEFFVEKEKLTVNQWNWVYYFIIQDLSLKEVAEMKGVSVETVKSWGKEARRKLRGD